MRSTPYPFAPQTFQWQLDIPGDATWNKIAQVYGGALQPAYQELFTSSVRIIQEHAVRAWVEGAQSCMTALMHNAARIQQRATADVVNASQKAATIYTRDVSDAVISKVTGN